MRNSRGSKRQSGYLPDIYHFFNLIIGDPNAAYKYSTDLAEYAKGDAKVLAQELCEHLYIRIQNDVTEIPDELIKKAEFVIHNVLMGFQDLGNEWEDLPLQSLNWFVSWLSVGANEMRKSRS